MKLLHSKSTAERILAVSACPCANLFGLVTPSAVTVYRSTTLTTVFSLSLTPFHPADQKCAGSAGGAGPHHAVEHYRCCWSPSGRLFTVALPSGILLVFDVEAGNLARVFTTSGTNASAPPPTPAAAAAAAAAPSSSSFPATVPWIATSLPPGRPVLAMTWCGVASSSPAQLLAMATDAQTRCLPVRLGVTTALFDEATQGVVPGAAGGGEGPAAGSGAPLNVEPSRTGAAGSAALIGESQSASTASVSLLTVLGSDGIVRCFVSGLYEVYAAPLALPSSSASRGLAWSDVTVSDMQWQQCAVGSAGDARERRGEAYGGYSKHDARHARVAALVSFGDTAADPVQPAVEEHHRLYLTVCERVTEPTPGVRGGVTESPPLPSQALWEANLQDRLAALAMPQWLAVCYVREYARIAAETYERVVRGWNGVLRGRVLAHLGLPAAAPLLSSAIVAQLADPDPIALYKYAKQTLMRAALAEDLEALAKMFRVVSYEVTHVCYRCCEVAAAYAVYTRGDVEGDGAVPHRDANEDGPPLPLPVGGTPSLVATLGALRRQYEAFLRQAANEGECARDLALWVMQQAIHWESGTHFVMGSTNANSSATAYGEEDLRDASSPAVGNRAGSPSPVLPPPPQQPVLVDEVPVSATRQPALYTFLVDIASTAGVTAADLMYPDGRGTSRLAEEAGDTSAARLYEQLTSCAEQRISSFGARVSPAAPAAPTRCSAMALNGTAGGAPAPDAGRQLLCCVVEDASDGADGGSPPASEADMSRQGDSEGSDEGQHHGGGARDEAGDAAPFSAYNSDDAVPQHAAAAPHTRSQPATLHALCSQPAVSGLIGPLCLSSYVLRAMDACSGAERDEQQMPGREPAAAGCELAQLNAADVDVASIGKHLNADFTKDEGSRFCCSWYGLLEEDRHVIVCQPASVLSQSGRGSVRAAKPNAPFFIAVVRDDGEVVAAGERDEDDEEAEEEALSNNEDASSGDAATKANEGSASRVALCQVTGMEGVPLRVSMSRARSFCVIVGVARYVMVSLYDDDY
ncbi:hypothetical protein ABL78_3964 [Leptomonas seymouri]|uniref:Uncharacterized protein n=1 Tax=Leptomonas seymouri TaxID=5684 RepID=A0A0N1I5F2_LEPSE|nr:hypothetical protein ABL78_3964 [Leptomonas seymouri]|eukprot:KPI86973.1 hypothetical protein ABL78_3964 [Leptomonas seymouri]